MTETDRPDRRRFLGQTGVVAAAAGAVWAAPAITSTGAASAATLPPGATLVATAEWTSLPAGPWAFTSTDAGSNWAGTGAQPDGNAYAVATDGAGRWVIAGEGGSVAWTSSDATTWTPVPPVDLPPGFSAKGLATDGAGRWSAVSNTVDQAYLSTTVDGTSWTAAATPGSGFDAAAVAHTAVGAGLWVAVGPGGAWRSADAASWAVAGSPLPADWNALAVAVDAAGLFVAVGPGSAGTGGAWTSTDGDVWTPAALAPVGIPAAVAHGPGGWAAVGRVAAPPDPDGRSWISADGSTWIESTKPVDTPGFGVATDALGAWVAVGVGSRSWTSTDNGDRWNQAPVPVTGLGTAVAFARLLS
jgi:hypothetical protein